MKSIDVLRYTTDIESTRYKHLMACYNLVTELLADVPISSDVKERIANTVLLHDIGYSHKLNITNCHAIDGYVYLEKNYPDICFHKAILLHSDLINHCPEEHRQMIENAYESLTDLEFAMLIILDYCDNHVDGLGNRVTIDERWKEIKNRHSDDSIVIQLEDELSAYGYHLENIIERIFKILPDIVYI